MSAPLHGLFDKRVSGDDALLSLAKKRFEEVGLAAELYAGSPADLEHVLRYAPTNARAPMVHLSRTLDLLRRRDLDTVCDFARLFGDRVSGFVVHDHHDTHARLDELAVAASRLSEALVCGGSAQVFLEYAAGSTLEQFVAVGERLARHDRVGLCIDIGHVGVWESRRRFAILAPDAGVDLTALRAGDRRLPHLVGAVAEAVAAGLPAVNILLDAVAAQSNPIHLHLHDGHPMVPNLADHFPFQRRLPLPFFWQGKQSLPMLFGVEGLGAIVRAANEHIAEDRLSMTLEIHQGYGRLGLEPEAAALFDRWENLTNAERQNAWLADVTGAAALVRAVAAL